MRTASLLASIACAVACGAAFGAAADATEVRFAGVFSVTATHNCLARYVGETFNSAFRPARVGDNPNFTSLSMLNQYSGDLYETHSVTLPLNSWTDVVDHGFTNVHYTLNTRILLRTQEPSRITSTTNFVVLTGAIETMGGDPGIGGKCIASFRGTYFRRAE
jgi:hypothetical protein